MTACGDLVRRRADVAGAEQQQQIAIAQQRRQRMAQFARVIDQNRIDLAARTHGARERAAVRVRDRRLAGRIDLGQHQHIRFGEHVGEVVE